MAHGHAVHYACMPAEAPHHGNTFFTFEVQDLHNSSLPYRQKAIIVTEVDSSQPARHLLQVKDSSWLRKHFRAEIPKKHLIGGTHAILNCGGQPAAVWTDRCRVDRSG